MTRHERDENRTPGPTDDMAKTPPNAAAGAAPAGAGEAAPAGDVDAAPTGDVGVAPAGGDANSAADADDAPPAADADAPPVGEGDGDGCATPDMEAARPARPPRPARPLDVDGSDELRPDEAALRRMLHQAVREIEPDDGGLDRLRRAIPTRRARKRHTLIGAAAAAAVVCVAVPALLHVSATDGTDGDRPAMAGHSEATPGGKDKHQDPDGGRPASPPADSDSSHHDKHKKGGGKDGDGSGGGKGDGGGPSGSLDSGPPPCTSDQLGDTATSVNPPDGAGKVYGFFVVRNISANPCTIGGEGVITTFPQGSADRSRISVLMHTDGDPAGQLPAPSDAPSHLALLPGSGYRVDFAWVPSGTCAPGSGDNGPGGDGSSPDPTPTGGGKGEGDDHGAPPAGDLTSQTYGDEQGVGSGSIQVSHTAEPGAPSTGTTIENACEGTLYHTGILPNR